MKIKHIILMASAATLLCNAISMAAVDPAQSVKKLEKRETRREAIAELEKAGKASLAHLMNIAKDSKQSNEVRVPAIVLIGKIKADEAMGGLEDILANDKDKYSREAAAIALGHLGNKQATPALQKALNDASGNVRMRAAWALAKMGDHGGKGLALKTLKGNDVSAQLLAVDALEAMGDKSILPELEKNAKNNNTWTRVHSKLAIKRISIQGLGDKQRIAYLSDTLNDKQYEVNNWAAIELGKTGTPEAMAVLKKSAKGFRQPGSRSAKKVLNRLVQQGKTTNEEHGQ